MENFEQNLNNKVQELLVNYKKFTEKNNNSAGSRTRKNAQELKKMLQDLRVSVLTQQKEKKGNKDKKKQKKELSEESDEE
tara:strand:- start:74 stop:313 length:240 start_codon:yes stop_codon:yes gene_type:complete